MSQRPGGAPFMDRLPQSVIDRFEATQKTAAKAKITLYRGEGSHEHPSMYSGDQAKDAGGWWTVDQEQAKGYAASVPEGKVYSLEIEPHEGTKSGSGVNYFIDDPEVRARRQEWTPPKTATVKEDGGCNGEGYLPRGVGEQLPDGTITGLCISCMQFHPMTEVIPPSKPEWKREFRLAPHTPDPS